MSSWLLILASLRQHWRVHTAVMLGVAAATAVMTGALLVGDSVRGSLRDLTLERLGRIDEVLVGNRFFRAELAQELSSEGAFQERFAAAVPMIVMQGAVETAGSDKARAGQVTILGCDPAFWELGEHAPPQPPGPDEVVLNESLAEQLARTIDGKTVPLVAGDEILLRFPKANAVPEDSALGRKTETVATRRLTVKAVIPAAGLGRFGIHPNQQLPRNAYVSLETLQLALDQKGKANAIFVAGKNAADVPDEAAHAALQAALHPSLADYGLSLQRVAPSKNGVGYFNLTSDRMVIEPAIEKAALAAWKEQGAQPALTYLANYVLSGDGDKGKIAYSTVTAVDFTSQSPLGPFVNAAGDALQALAPGEIAINRWVADDFAAQGAKLAPGDGVTLTFFEPESIDGKAVERSVTLKLSGIVEMNGAAVDQHFTPEVKGVTDQDSINDWDPPFPFHPERVRSKAPDDQDEKYWDQYKATPKAFVSLMTGQELWHSRFGKVTTIRVPEHEGQSAEQLAGLLRLDPASMGLEFRPVKRYGLLAASGTTPFGLLFLGFSMFLIAAALMLVTLLFRLGCERRADEMGLLLAVGFSAGRVRRLWGWEAVVVAAKGGVIGVALGVAYAWLMLAALRSPDWWLAAVTTPFLQLHVNWTSLFLGYACGVLVSLATVFWSLRQMGKQSVRGLLGGQVREVSLKDRRNVWLKRACYASLPLAIVLGAVGQGLSGEAQAGAFFGSGALLLTGLLTGLALRLRGSGGGSLVATGPWPLTGLAARNGARHPGRSSLTVGLVAAATFLIVAISAFHIDPADRPPEKSSGDGGFALIAQSDLPLFYDLNTAEGRRELGVPDKEQELFASARVVPLRVQPGDDASCLNLYQTAKPTVLGVPPELVERGGFAWASTAAASAEEKQNPWRLLDRKLSAAADGVPRVPVVVDMNTAMYSLHKGVGDWLELEDSQGEPYQAQIMGLLKNSLFQGDVLMSQANFLQRFPGVSGSKTFLIESPPDQTAALEQALEGNLGDFGFDAELTGQRLAGFLAVQNTYLSTFQSLGGLGLLLGTFGLATVQLRNVFERRGELALLRAAGFAQGRLAKLVMLENALLLLGGLGLGCLAALLAIWPHLLAGGAAIPWRSLAISLGLVLVVGSMAGLAAVRATLKAPLLPALRGE